ncbi:CPBP family intramembrane glutamic endopeptidase [Hymenobacter sp. DG25A]|uniref:CPBP family intramembrane glutamic endopeptidase n=1 Tax=Hymenobacter sp. DG25A TaxID=1385663 RepID=UPI0009E6CF50|nr:type II CAAX endopeptidase family protein [Hymenobacter sp. DG25A]
METTVLERPIGVSDQPAYPTIRESWAFVGWYLLVVFGVGVPLFLLGETVFSFSRSVTVVVITIAANLSLLSILRWRAGTRWLPIRLQGQESASLYAVMPVLILTAILVLSLLDLLHLPNWADKTFQNLANTPVLAFVMLCVAAPVLEELLFRGVLLPGLLRNYPQRPWVAIGQSALVFGIIHGNPAQLVGAGLLGLLLGWLYYRTSSLGICIVVHALNNFVAFLGMVVGGKELVDKSIVDIFESWWVYAGVVALSALVLYWLLRRIWFMTEPVVTVSLPEEAGQAALL